MMSNESDYYVSIDFGTSGCAIAKGCGNPDPERIEVFSAWTVIHTGIDLKQPTILLANPNGEFVEFGVEAWKAYEKLKDKAKDYYFFYRFKMNLYDSPNAETIQAANGKSLPAVHVYAMTLKYLKDVALEWIDKLYGNSVGNIHWIVTVPAIWTDAAKEVMRRAAAKVGLSRESMVFAYEPEAAALFSRLDLLRDEQTYSEASYLVVDCGGGTVDIVAHKMTKQLGHVYIDELCHPIGDDCGGFAVNDQFEKLIMDILKIPLQQFQQLKINCSAQWTELINVHFELSKVMLDPKEPFAKFTLPLHKKICNEIKKLTGKSMEELVENYGDEYIEWDGDERDIVLHFHAMNKIFCPVLDEVCKLIKRVLEKSSCQQVDIILLVGGFAESALLLKNVQESFPKINVYRSSTPTYSVVKGAVLCGQHENLIKPILKSIKIDGNPSPALQPSLSNSLPDMALKSDSADDVTNTFSDVAILEEPIEQITMDLPSTETNAEIAKQLLPPITKHLPPTITMATSIEIAKHLPPPISKHLPFVVSRKMRYSVGVETTEPFKTNCHDPSRKFVHGKEDYCAKVFFPLVKANESIYVGAATRQHRFRPLTNEQSYCVITIFASESEVVKYIDDIGCQKRAIVEISDLPKCNTDLSREVEICVDFYSTELEITAHSVTSQETKKVTVSYEFSHTT